MSTPAPISGASSVPTKDDAENRAAVWKLIQSENRTVVGFAKHIVTVCFAAIGVTFTLQEKWLAGVAHPEQPKALLGIAVALYLGASLVASMAIAAYRLRVTLSDYGDVEAELGRVAVMRVRMTVAALVLLVLATVFISIVALRAAG
jgi:hypothetical protein